MLNIKSLFGVFSLVAIATGCMLLTFPNSADAARFDFDEPYDWPGSNEPYSWFFDISLPLSFEDSGTILSVSANTGYWGQSNLSTSPVFSGVFFPNMSGGIITNGLRLAAYPAETLTLQFNRQFNSFNADYAVAFPNPHDTYFYQLTLTAFLDNILIDSYTIYKDIDNIHYDFGSFSFLSLTSFNRIVITTSPGADFAIDNVVVTTPLPGAFFLMLPAISLLLAVRRGKEKDDVFIVTG
jgi:hypothetical protein